VPQTGAQPEPERKARAEWTFPTVYPMAPVSPVLPRPFQRRWVQVGLTLGLLVVLVLGMTFLTMREHDASDRPAPKAPASAKVLTVADYVNGGGITYHAPNGDYSVALPSEPTVRGDTVSVGIDGATLSVSDHDLGATAPREPLLRVKEVQDVERIIGKSKLVAQPELDSNGSVSVTFSTSGFDEQTPLHVDVHRVLLIGSHVFVLTVSEGARITKAFDRLSESFAPNPSLSSF
jgi:hypothetical protein